MGANPTQAQGLVLFLIAFVCLAVALATGNLLFVALFAALLAGAVVLFLKCKPWEHNEE
jgi:hypothetical protein